MALTTNMVRQEKEEQRVGERRFDVEGKGYFHTFTKDEMDKKYVVEIKQFEKEELDMDLNKDGKVDKKDLSIAAKVMRKAKSIKRASRGNKK